MQIKTGLGFLVAAALAHALVRPRQADRRRRESVRSSLTEPLALAPVSSPAVATGALALGALAVGALTIGALAIGRLEIGRARFRKLQIDDLTVHRFHVADASPDAPDEAGEADA